MQDNRDFVDLSYPSLAGKKIILTGGSSGIGNETAKKLLKNGADVYLLGRRPEVLSKLGDYPKRRGAVRVFYCDLERPIDMKGIFSQIMEETGGVLDGLINCAGIIQNNDYRDTLLDEWDKTMTVNVRAPMQLMSMAVPFMRNKGGSVVNVSDSPIPKPKQTIYCVSKACMNSLTECSALELAAFNIRVNGVAPGTTYTEFRVGPQGLNPEENEEYMKRAAEKSLNHKVALAKDAANAIVWLVSDESSFVNGEILTVDGGTGLMNESGTLSWQLGEEEPRVRESVIARGIKKIFTF